MKKILDNKRIIYLFCLIISFVALLITSKNSPLYQYNDWMDANAFFTVGKSMLNGIVPYKDIFEQKGLFLYFIYGIGYLISHKTFQGVFILEVIFFSVFLYYLTKIIKMFLNNKYIYVIIPLITLLITTNSAFVHGGSAEEFSLTFMAITLYYFFKHFEKEPLNNKELIVCGLCAGFILLIKYTILGFWIGFMLSIVIFYLKNKEYKKMLMSCIYFLIGMLIPFIISLLYMAINHGVKDFFNVYFYINMTAYTKDSSNFIVSFFSGFYKLLIKNNFVFILIVLLPFLIYKLKINKKSRISLAILFILTVFFLFYGLVFYSYYILPVFIFLIISLIGIFSILSKYLDNFKYYYFIVLFLLIIFPIITYNSANYKDDIGRNKDEFVHYKYAEVINQEKNPTLVNMGYLDMGLYTIADVLPSTYFFELQNISYEKFPDNIDSFHNYIDNKKTMFILFSTRKDIDYVFDNYPNLFNNYNLILDDAFYTEGDCYNMFLFKVK